MHQLEHELDCRRPRRRRRMRLFPGIESARGCRRGVAVVELACLLPLLVFLFLVAIDFARAYYFSLTLTNCARAGAMYACDPSVADESPFASTEAAAQAEAPHLTTKPTISQSSGSDGSGKSYVQVTASYSFSTLTRFPGIPSRVNLSRTVRMYVLASTPNT